MEHEISVKYCDINNLTAARAWEDAYIEGRLYGLGTVPMRHQYTTHQLGIYNIQNQN